MSNDTATSSIEKLQPLIGRLCYCHIYGDYFIIESLEPIPFREDKFCLVTTYLINKNRHVKYSEPYSNLVEFLILKKIQTWDLIS